MIKAKTLENLILSMGKQKKTNTGDGSIITYGYETSLNKEQHDKWLEQFKLLESNGCIHGVGDNELTLDTCATWSGNNDTDYRRFVVTLLKDILIMQWVTKFSIE